MKTIIKYKIFSFFGWNCDGKQEGFYIKWMIIKAGECPTKFHNSLDMRPSLTWDNNIDPYVWLENKYKGKYKLEEVK